MKIYIISGVSALVVGACTQVPTPLPPVDAQQDIVNSAITSPLRYQDPLAGYTYRAPTGPRDWRAVNQEQSEGN